MNAALEQTYEPHPSIVTRQVAGETILVPVGRASSDEPALYTLDETASFLWGRLSGRPRGSDLVNALQEAYEVSAETAARDVEGFLSDLLSIEAIRLSPGSAADA